MLVVNMKDLAETMAAAWKVQIKVIGAGPGEKTDEMLIGPDEMPRTEYLDDGTFVIGWKQPENPIGMEVLTTESVTAQNRKRVRQYIEDVI
jgi:FlaA1/EpsC-like NDP-sugar epimerase